MSGAPAEIDIIATDEASEVFQDVSSNFTAMSNDVSEASEQTSTAVTQSNQSFSTSAMQMNTMAMSGAMLYMAVNNVENSEVSLSRAHLTEEKAANAVTLAQQAYNKAVAEYGPTACRRKMRQSHYLWQSRRKGLMYNGLVMLNATITAP